MINQNKILEKAIELLEDYPDTSATVIQQSSPINQNVNRSPWIGVYPNDEEFTPGRLGSIDAWDRNISFRIVVQRVYGKAGSSGEEAISQLIQHVMTAIMENTSEWSGLIDLFSSVKVEHGFREDETGTVRFRESVIVFSGTAASSVA